MKYPTQKEILELMCSGWELGKGTGLDSRPWIQENGLGKGGQVKSVHLNTITALLRRKLIRWIYVFPTGRYELVEKDN